MVPRKMTGSRLIMAGHVVGSTDGTVWLVRSSVKTKDGLNFRLASLNGKPVSTPAGFDPISFRMARFATLLRLAYNKDFDKYVKDYILQAGLPVDPAMNWGKYLYKRIGMSVPTKEPDYIDEAIHNTIVNVVMRHTLEPPNFQNTVDNFTKKNPAFPNLPLEKQVTIILKNTFNNRVSEAIRYVQESIFDQDTSQDVTGQSFVSIEPETEEGTSPIDTKEHATGTGEFKGVEEDIEMGHYRGGKKYIQIGRFSAGFRQWLLRRRPRPRQYMRLLTLLYEDTKASGKLPKLDDIEKEWKRDQWMQESSKNRWTHEDFERVFHELPNLMELYVRTHFHGQEGILPNIIRLLTKIGRERREKQLQGAQSHQEERRLEKETGKAPLTTAPARFPEPSTAALNKQWEAPKCEGCQSAKELKSCPTCKKHHCLECSWDHIVNYPGHDKVGEW